MVPEICACVRDLCAYRTSSRLRSSSPHRTSSRCPARNATNPGLTPDEHLTHHWLEHKTILFDHAREAGQVGSLAPARSPSSSRNRKCRERQDYPRSSRPAHLLEPKEQIADGQDTAAGHHATDSVPRTAPNEQDRRNRSGFLQQSNGARVRTKRTLAAQSIRRLVAYRRRHRDDAGVFVFRAASTTLTRPRTKSVAPRDEQNPVGLAGRNRCIDRPRHFRARSTIARAGSLFHRLQNLRASLTPPPQSTPPKAVSSAGSGVSTVRTNPGARPCATTTAMPSAPLRLCLPARSWPHTRSNGSTPIATGR